MKPTTRWVLTMAVASSFATRSAQADEARTDEYHGTVCQLTSDVTNYKMAVGEDGVVLRRLTNNASSDPTFICPINVSTDYSAFSVRAVKSEITKSNPTGNSSAPTCNNTLVSTKNGKVIASNTADPGLQYLVDHAYLYCTQPISQNSGSVSPTVLISAYKIFMTYIDAS
jgi:hypothetical protein